MSIRAVAVDGLDGVRLTAGSLEATFVPAAGMVGASLCHGGEELLDAQDGVRAYRRTGATMGIPFLHPWANRLASDRYAIDGRVVELPRELPRDPHGLPIHGVLPQEWRVLSAQAVQHRVTLLATCDFDDACFPFAHRLEQRVTLDPTGLMIETMVRAGAGPVPIAFGFHPYLRLPGAARRSWTLSLPQRRRLETDERLIPTGAAVAEGPETFALGERVFDDGYDRLGECPRFELAGGGRRIVVTFLSGYPVAQVYAPADRDVVCFEPMTAPTNALVSGDGLRVLQRGEGFGAAYRIRVE